MPCRWLHMTVTTLTIVGAMDETLIIQSTASLTRLALHWLSQQPTEPLETDLLPLTLPMTTLPQARLRF